ncbi:methylmalonyl-CoA mutase small subunit [Amycolatopsis acidiphila]|uniref:Methylmalonyl-CoA mutase small subunit n=1 Tax=Amycolatopsis acidiphila TaxID=715473 RepID=A0A557ZYB8_9PSEU|nr:methylmalonyl-CoA mutase small subunit [Amycolatopsis acidiphila]TVT17002.1 methylmalonyl-CoA mutase small subunit [Amycolatopsis acidiphila]UIJ60854.1 methylmalonyl-CoA mutase small subunit [Amycolatopsis acidiphila]GHG94858.1 methylmalonyl-CoA mutase [Amycolatopsis acidiphila]
MTQAGTTEPDELALAAEFAAPARADWQELVAGVLRKSGRLPEDFDGAPESLLTTRTYDGIDIRPLYTAEDETVPAGFPGLAPFVRGGKPEGAVGTGWDVRVLHANADPVAANKAILADLENGASSLWLRVGGDSLPPSSLADALNEVYLDLAPVVLEPGAEYEAAASALLRLLAERNIPDSEVIGTIGADPITVRARTGTAHDLTPAAELAARLAAKHPKLRTIVVDGLPYHEAGGSDAQELGAAVAAGVAYLRALTAAGLSVDDAAAQLEFRFAATADQFLTIAKLRAARRLWSRVTEVSGATPHGMRQHAVTSTAMLTQRDPWVNMLRTTVACFAAGVGGADAVTVLPFDAAIGQPEAFSRRIARNTQAILIEESRLAGVIDPAGGSWYVENLTDALANAAWREFTEVERHGGIEAALESGFLRDRLAQTWEKRAKRLATRKDPITGVSEFPHLAEKPVVREPLPSIVEGGGLPKRRYAQPFEQLRDRSDAHLAEHGERPTIFLATLGPLASHTARAMFASNLFQAGGIEPVNPGAVDDPVEAFKASGATVACLCGSDKSYGEQANEVAAGLRAAGAKAVLLAGRPDESYRGISGFAHTGCDALAVLTSTLETLGVK